MQLKNSLISFAIGAVLSMALVRLAHAAPACKDYTRTVYLGNGVPYAAAGTACLGSDGVWRVAAEHLQGALVTTPVPIAVADAPVVVAPAPAYYGPYAYPGGYYGDPWLWSPSFVSFGFGFNGGDHWGHGGYHGGDFHRR